MYDCEKYTIHNLMTSALRQIAISNCVKISWSVMTGPTRAFWKLLWDPSIRITTECRKIGNAYSHCSIVPVRVHRHFLSSRLMILQSADVCAAICKGMTGNLKRKYRNESTVPPALKVHGFVQRGHPYMTSALRGGGGVSPKEDVVWEVAWI